MPAITIILLIAAAAIAVTAIYGGIVFNILLCRKQQKKRIRSGLTHDIIKSAIHSGTEWAKTVPFEDVRITSDDGLSLCAKLLNTNSDKTAILTHGYHSGYYARFFDAKKYAENGFNILIICHRAHPESDGRYIGMGYLEKNDLLAFTEYIRDNIGGKIIYDGVSMGAVTCILAACEAPENLRCVVSDCGYTSAQEILSYHLKTHHLPPMFTMPILRIMALLIAHYDLKKADALSSIKNCLTPIIFIHGTADTFVTPDASVRMHASLSAPKELLLVDSARHGAARAISPDLCYEHIFAFMKSHTDLFNL